MIHLMSHTQYTWSSFELSSSYARVTSIKSSKQQSVQWISYWQGKPMIGLGSDKKDERPGEAPLLHRGCIGKGSQRQSFDIFQDRRAGLHNLAALFEAIHSCGKMLTCVLCAFVNRCTENAPRFTIVSSFQEEASRFSPSILGQTPNANTFILWVLAYQSLCLRTVLLR